MFCFGNRLIYLGMCAVYIPFLSSQEECSVLKKEQDRNLPGKGGLGPPCCEEQGTPQECTGGPKTGHNWYISISGGSQEVTLKRRMF